MDEKKCKNRMPPPAFDGLLLLLLLLLLFSVKKLGKKRKTKSPQHVFLSKKTE